ncbi:MAG: bifunctional rhamnulose-1-phosphate aldolase/short-chain dehydrogenase [Candidatus Rokubacteria bacterium]|nr:bifunctional rhamnulose-1-phosphate aldolase/short-chain dehydrogenase [Candidatus Rokubacteria bacterium]
MKSHWSDDEVKGLEGLDLLVYASRLVGAEPSLVVWGGGNTSLKVTEPDLLGRPIRVLRVKGSGSDLKSIVARDFPGVLLEPILALLKRADMDDQEMVAYLARCLQEPDSPRPSIEALLHGFLPSEAVIHTHADAVVALTNNARGREAVQEVYGKDVALIPYRRPGFLLSKEVAEGVRAHPRARGVILEKHGLITWGGTLKEAYGATMEAIKVSARGRRPSGPARPRVLDAAARRDLAVALAPILRGAVSRERRVLLRYDDSEPVLEFVSSPEAARLSQVGPATPDHTIHTKRVPLFVEVEDPSDLGALSEAVRGQVEAFARGYTEYFEAHRFPGATLLDPYPRVILIPGLGMFTTGKEARAALIAAEIYHRTVWVLGAASAFGPYASLTPKEAFDVEYWPLELYKLAKAPPERELARRIVLVTGGASGIGRAVARRLAQEGAHVVVADLDHPGAEQVARELEERHGAGRALGVAMDVTAEASVRSGIRAAVEACGGLDVVVSNAGIAPAGAIDAMALADWERSLAVNATGHFLVAREALRVMKAQGLGGSFVFVATKNVMAPGKEFAAYSAAKAAEAQLAKVLAIEGGPSGIRANIVNPDAVFRDSRLWSEEVRAERARAHGIAPGELEEFYRRRNLLGVPVLPEDVAEAVLFLASDRAAKTTGCTLTVDGGVRDAFPR